MVKDYPKTLLEFERWFRTEEACRAYLVRLRWPEGFRCRRCANRQAWQTSRGRLHCGACRADTSITAGTIFHGSHISLRLWFRAMWWVTNQKSGVSALGLQRTLGLGSYRTAWACLHKLRRAMVRPGRDQLSGKVEVDEIVIGGRRKGARSWKSDKSKAIVVVGAEVRGEGTGRIRLQQIPDTSGETLTRFVKQYIIPGSRVITDGDWGYKPIVRFGYTHDPTPLAGKGPEASNVTLRRVHRVSSLLKRWILGIHQGRISPRQLAHYLDEFTFRFNRRLSGHRGMLFYRLAQQSVALGPVPYRTLVKKAQTC